ncbi:MAG: hypothetical protein H8E55_48430, partial [Pelagibacterales bacterium]|nr:hypothetical protein [Pelagibacterales bacterium]
MDKDSIIREWFYRLPKGYATLPYSKAEMSILHEILAENGLNGSVFVNEIDQLDQAFLDAKPVEEAAEDLKDPKFDSKLPERLATELGLQEVLVNIVMAEYNKLSQSEKDAFKKGFRSQSIEEFVNGGWKPYTNFFARIGEVKGLGRGEIQILLAVKDSRTGGTGKHDIVMDDGEWEVKELTKSGTFDPAKYGNPNKHDLTWPLKDFYELVVGPFEEMLDQTDSIKSVLDEASHDRVDQLVEIFNTYFTFKDGKSNNSANKMFNFREISKKPFQRMYEGFQELNKLFGTTFDNDVQDTRLTIKGKETDTYWVSDEDAEKIKKAAGESKPISISIGDEIDDENKNVVVWFKRLE